MELQLQNITKRYSKGAALAVDGISYTFTPGVYGLLGPNGAGKSTLMNIMTDNLPPTSGKITLDGVEIGKMGPKYRSALGYMPQQQGLYDEFTGEQFLWYMAALKGLPRAAAKKVIEDTLQTVNLDKDRHKKLKGYSGGMKQRILIAQALLNDPGILIMDEPTAGLDPKERIRIRSFISEISKDKIVLIATHVVSDVEFISKEILVMNGGRIIKDGTPQALIQDMEGKVFETVVTEEEHQALVASGIKIAGSALAGDKLCVRVVTDTPPTVGEVTQVRPNLEDVYLWLVE